MIEKILAWVEMHFFKAIVLIIFALVLVLCLIIYNVGHAANVEVSWTQPTTNVDGSTIPTTGPGRLIGNRVEWGTCVDTAFGVAAGQQVFAVPTVRYTVLSLLPGTHCFRAYASTTYGESAASTAAQKVIVPPLPNPPTIVTATTVAYKYRQINGELSLARAFVVQRGVPCGKVIGRIDGKNYRQVSPLYVAGTNPGPFVTRCKAA